MSNNWTYRLPAEDVFVLSLPVDSGTVIEVGDLCYWDTDDVKNAAAIADQGTEAQNKAYFSARFIGVALDASASGETADIRIARVGQFEYALDTALVAAQAVFTAVEVGADATDCDDQIVEIGSTSAIGRLVKAGVIGDTKVTIEIYNIKNPFVTAA